jgi:hypothetical protein
MITASYREYKNGMIIFDYSPFTGFFYRALL